MLLFWPLIGALIGVYAAQKKGFSTVGGVIGGLLLGPLAFLLFFVSGLVSSNEQQRKCSFCAEWIKPEARLCKHCGKDVPAAATDAPPLRQGMSIVTKVVLGAGAAFAVLIVAVAMSRDGSSSPTSSPRIFTPNVTMAEFAQLQTGMTYDQVVEIIGAPGEELSRSDIGGFTTVMFAWKNANASNMNAMFQNGGLVNKAQFGLR